MYSFLKNNLNLNAAKKLIKLNTNTVYYVDENNRYLRASFKDLES
ncbi:hypothetical protein LEP1GSC116_0491, partial [Leptospira interrogans serovar Icterohaemorrhagiae str. Verdun HP]